MGLDDQKKSAIMTCIDLVLMRRSMPNYNLVVNKLNLLYKCKIFDCYENPEYLRTVLKEVYKGDYNSVIEEIKLKLEYLVDIEKEKSNFCKVLES